MGNITTQPISPDYVPIFSNFINWEKSSRDTIDFKKIYVDMAGDLVAGLALSEIVYWYLPNRDGDTKLRVIHDNNYWIACKRKMWHERVRMTPRQVDRAMTLLQDRGIIEKRVYKFAGTPIVHVRLVLEVFLLMWNDSRHDDEYVRLYESVKSPVKENPTLRIREVHFTNPLSLLTETTTEKKEKDSVHHSMHDMLSSSLPNDAQPTIEELQSIVERLSSEITQLKAPKAKGERKPKDASVSTEPKPKTNRDLIFDAVTEHMWKIRDAKPIGKTATRIGMAVSEIISNDKNATAADIPVFAKWCAGYIPQDPAKVGAAWLRWRSQTQATTQRQEELTWELPEDVRNMGKLDSYLNK